MKNVIKALGNTFFIMKNATMKFVIVGFIILAFAFVFTAGCDCNTNSKDKTDAQSVRDSVSQTRSEDGHKGHEPGPAGKEHGPGGHGN